MNVNPWQPPAGWDRSEAERARSAFTVRNVLRLMVDAFRRQPVVVVLAVFVVPGLWEVPSTLAGDLLVPETEPIFGPGRSPRSIAVSWAGVAWTSVWSAGQLTAAIDAVRDRAIRWRPYLTGVKLAPALFSMSVVLFFPFEALSLLPSGWRGGGNDVAFDALGIVLTAYLAARTCLWSPLLVDGRRPFWGALADSWALTRGSAPKLFALAAILLVSALPIAVVEMVFGGRSHVFIACVSVLFALAMAAVYALVLPEPGKPAGPAPAALSDGSDGRP